MKLIKTNNMRLLLPCYLRLKLADGLESHGMDRQYQMSVQVGYICLISTLNSFDSHIPLGSTSVFQAGCLNMCLTTDP